MKLKKIVSTIMAGAIIVAGIGASALEIKTYSEELNVYYNGTDVYEGTGYQPIIINERTMVRLVPIFEKMGWSNYSYDDATKSASFYGDNVTYIFSDESNNAIIRNVDGSEQTKALDVPATIYNDVFYVPLRAFCEMAGADIQWNADERSVYVSEAKIDVDQAPVEHIGSKHFGTWYYTPYTADYTEEDIYPVEITAMDNNKAKISGLNENDYIVTFVSENKAVTDGGTREDAYGNMRETVIEITFGVDYYGNEYFNIDGKYKDDGSHCVQTSGGYRTKADFFF